MHNDIVCGLDIGSSSLRTTVLKIIEPYCNERERILGFAASPARGFSKGVVTNLNLLSDAIEETVSKAEEKAHCRIKKLIINISGAHIRTFKSRGSVHIADRPSEIKKHDIERCIESAKLIAMSLDREVIHLIPESFYIDDKIEIQEPLGLFGSKLDVEVNIITSLFSIIQNLTKAVNLAGCEVEEAIISGLGTGLAVFEADELESGSVIIDVGKDITEATLFKQGSLRESFYFPFGSDDLTQALQDRLKIMFNEAEELRIKYGIVSKRDTSFYDDSQILITPLKDSPGPWPEDTQSGQIRSGGNWVHTDGEVGIRLYNRGNQRQHIVSRQQISSILFPKVEEIMQDVYKKVVPFLRQKNLPRIAVVGGVSRMDGFVEAVEDILGVPVDLGRIRNTEDPLDTDFACSLGLARFGIRKRFKERRKYLMQTNIARRFFSRLKKFLSEYF